MMSLSDLSAKQDTLLGKVKGKDARKKLSEHISDAEDDFEVELEITIIARCRSCGERYAVHIDIDDLEKLDPSMNYCGRNQFCLP